MSDDCPKGRDCLYSAKLYELAEEILRLRAENEKLRAELRDADVMLLNQARTIRDYQDAAAALKETGNE